MLFCLVFCQTERIVRLPTTYIKDKSRKKTPKLETAQEPILSEVQYGLQTIHFLKGLESRHIAYYFDDIPIPYPLSGCETHLDKLPTMVTKGSGLGGAMLYTLPQKKFQSGMGISTNKGIEHRTHIHTEKNNHFFTGALVHNNDGGWQRTPSRYQQSLKDHISSIEGSFQTGHQDSEQKLTVSSVNQYLQNTYDDLFVLPSFREQEYQRYFNLFGVAYERRQWRTFAALYSSRTQGNGTLTQNIVLTAGTHKTDTDHHLGFFTQQINNHKVYHYDVYGGKKIGPFYSTLRLIKTERQILCPFEVSVQLASPIKIICGSVYHLPDEFQRFDPQYGNFDLKPEHNYHCHIVHNWEKSKWTFQQTLFVNRITDLIDFSFGEKFGNHGKLNSIGIDQSISYDGFDRYKIGYNYTLCVLDGSESLFRRPSWKFHVWQRVYLSEDCHIDFRTYFMGPCLDGDRLDFKKQCKMPGVFLIDTTLSSALNKNWTVVVEVKNLANRYYENPSGYQAKSIEAWLRLVYTL